MKEKSLTFIGDTYLQKDEYVKFPFNNVVPNIEAPVTSASQRYPGKINLKSSKKTLQKFIAGNDVVAACIGNNHIFDYGKQGLDDTIEFFQELSVPCFGVKDKSGTYQKEYLIVQIENKKIGLLSQVCLSTSAIFSSEETVGVIEKNVDLLLKSIIAMKSEKVDFIAIIMHWGAEEVPFANIEDIKFARKCIDNGADIVIGHHSHCIQQYEFYKNKWIFYGLGNAFFNDIDLPGCLDKPGGKSLNSFKKEQQYWNRKGLAVHVDLVDFSVTASKMVNKKTWLECKPFKLRKKTLIPLNVYGNLFRFLFVLSKLRVYFFKNCKNPRLPRLNDLRILLRLIGNTKYS